MTETTNRAERRRNLWPWAIAAGLTLAVGINLAMVWIAVSHRSQPVPGDVEQDALDYDQTIAKQRASAALGWRVTLGACRIEADGACEVVLEVVDRDGRGIDGLHGTIVARRADDARLDREADIRELGVGRYGGTLESSTQGLHVLSIALEHGDEKWSETRELWVEGSTSP
jgi:nitrogen fixation protein FixH